jgi:prefoldin subunit 5
MLFFFFSFLAQEDVEAYVSKFWEAQATDEKFTADGSKNLTAVATGLLKSLQELYGKYKFMEKQLVQQKRGLLQKIPEIESALAVLTHVTDKVAADETVSAQFELSDAVYVKAEIAATKTVMLWLGANVMVEYTHDEAHELLSTNLRNAQETLEQLTEHLDGLKDQITISEVNVARVHNYRVSLMQAEKQAAGKATGKA